MNTTDAKKIARLLAAAYPASSAIHEDTVPMWCVVLEPYKYEDVRAAAVRYIATRKYYPRPAELLADLAPPPEAPKRETWDMSPEQERHADEAMKRLLKKLKERKDNDEQIHT